MGLRRVIGVGLCVSGFVLDHWTYQLHYDNLKALVKSNENLGPLQSYSTVRRYMVAQGMLRKPRLKPKKHPGELRAAQRRERREIRSYEVEHVGALWHLDFHHGSLQVVTPRGLWERPLALGILDDHSRYCPHLQWYLSETTEDLVHGVSQGIQKCGLPRAAMSDNGSAMLADEFTGGLLQLGILHETTLPFSAYQNGKQECFWAQLEGRLMEMLGRVRELTLDFLNEATQAWVEVEYNRRVHREIGCSPVTRFGAALDVLRPAPSVCLNLVVTDAETAYLEVVAELNEEKRRHLHEQVLALLPQNPTLAVRTSEGRYQVYWRLDQPVNIAEQEKLMAAMAIDAEADRAATDVSRVLRLPTFWNRKPGRENTVDIVFARDHAVSYKSLSQSRLTSGSAHSLPETSPSTLRDALPVLGRLKGRRTLSTGGLSESERDWYEVHRRLALGHSPAEVANWLERKRTDKPNPTYYAQLTVAKAVKAATRPVLDRHQGKR